MSFIPPYGTLCKKCRFFVPAVVIDPHYRFCGMDLKWMSAGRDSPVVLAAQATGAPVIDDTIMRVRTLLVPAWFFRVFERIKRVDPALCCVCGLLTLNRPDAVVMELLKEAIAERGGADP